MRRISCKKRLWIGTCLVLLAIFAILATIIYGAYEAPLWFLIAGPIVAALAFILGIIFVPATHEDGSPIVKTKKRKKMKEKKPFISNKEWNEQEEEDDEMIFIEEIVEDEK